MPPRHEARRRAEHRAAALVRMARRLRTGLAVVAGTLGVAARTLRDLRARRTRRCATRGHGRGPGRGRSRGRPPASVAKETLDAVDEMLDECKGRIGVATLRQDFRQVPRARLERATRAWRRRHAETVERLAWTSPGSVWAADWTEPQPPIETLGRGVCRRMLVVRDLASGMQLLALPAEHATADVAADALESLIMAHGAPLVLKTDNGSNVAEAQVRELLARAGIMHLRSPARTPRYNGAVEAGIGSIKVRLHHIAAANGRPECPTFDDVEAARLEANASPCSRWRGDLRGLSPDERWSARSVLSDEQRQAFAEAVHAANRAEAAKLVARRAADAAENPKADAHDAAVGPLNSAADSAMLSSTDALVDPLTDLGAHDRATVARRAIRRALEALGYLTARRTANSSTDLQGESGGN